MATEILDIVRSIPHGARANCYTFALAPPVGDGGFAMRPSKAQPGEKCFGGRHAPALPLRDARASSFELLRRILCDNPRTVRVAVPRYDPSILEAPVRGERQGRAHVMACIAGPDDFHFCRRIFTRTAIRSTSKLQPLTDAQLAELLEGERQGRRYVWVHQRGWSAASPSGLGARRLRWRRSVGVRPGDLHKFGSPTVLDADGRICWSPVPREADWRRCFTRRPPTNGYHYPSLNYNRFVGVFRVGSRRATVLSDSGAAASESLAARERAAARARARRPAWVAPTEPLWG